MQPIKTSLPRPKATVFYDGICPICSREIAHYRRAKGASEVEFIDAARCGDGELAEGLVREEALAMMHVRLADGSMVTGVAAFAALWRQLPTYRLLGWMAGLPVVLPALEVFYKVFLVTRRLWRR